MPILAVLSCTNTTVICAYTIYISFYSVTLLAGSLALEARDFAPHKDYNTVCYDSTYEKNI
jgi:hypothetical protein